MYTYSPGGGFTVFVCHVYLQILAVNDLQI